MVCKPQISLALGSSYSFLLWTVDHGLIAGVG